MFLVIVVVYESVESEPARSSRWTVVLSEVCFYVNVVETLRLLVKIHTQLSS